MFTMPDFARHDWQHREALSCLPYVQTEKITEYRDVYNQIVNNFLLRNN